ncbi:hypothetical protein [Pedobacter sp. CG_S7]|uniref:hypothetical protein n=1 Tax=Pedobacter sp. CG_S7 TaxID=3143930 RepID=UPI003394D796
MKIFFSIFFIAFPFLSWGQSYKIGDLNVSIEGKDENFKREVKISSIISGITEIEISIKADRQADTCKFRSQIKIYFSPIRPA